MTCLDATMSLLPLAALKKGTRPVENAPRQESYRQAFKPRVLSLSAEAATAPHAQSTLAKEQP